MGVFSVYDECAGNNVSVQSSSGSFSAGKGKLFRVTQKGCTRMEDTQMMENVEKLWEKERNWNIYE